MPALSHGRQPDPGHGPGPAPGQGAALRWFGEVSGHGLLEVESGAMARVLGASPPLPWAWFGVAAAPPHGRGVALRRSAEGFDGALRCRLPLPLASEAFGAVLLQHVFDDGADPLPLLGECAYPRPGGRLWLATLNPWSPYRLRWARSGLRARRRALAGGAAQFGLRRRSGQPAMAGPALARRARRGRRHRRRRRAARRAGAEPDQARARGDPADAAAATALADRAGPARRRRPARRGRAQARRRRG
ncbi:hypothetical protein FE772_08595 [Lysobacter enzymogenes]|nr:hypothetical protein [Lysobacter enzymogenes]QCW25719.1 hypothetical protein FE772_08595 [Lysobacter enzymogenes]